MKPTLSLLTALLLPLAALHAKDQVTNASTTGDVLPGMKSAAARAGFMQSS
jgi:hypothetical protein